MFAQRSLEPGVIYSLKELAHFLPKVLVDFLHVQYIDLCLTGDRVKHAR